MITKSITSSKRVLSLINKPYLALYNRLSKPLRNTRDIWHPVDIGRGYSVLGTLGAMMNTSTDYDVPISSVYSNLTFTVSNNIPEIQYGDNKYPSVATRLERG